MGIQVCRFHDGGYVLHKIAFNGRKYSAWFRADGAMHDAELVNNNGSTRAVKPTGEVWRELARVGRVYSQLPARLP